MRYAHHLSINTGNVKSLDLVIHVNINQQLQKYTNNFFAPFLCYMRWDSHF